MVRKKKPPVEKDPRASELCNEIRRLYFTKEPGWIARPSHEHKQIRIGHPGYGTDDEVSSELYALFVAIDRLGLADAIGYEVKIVKK